MENVCKHCKKRIVLLQRVGCYPIWLHFTTQKKECVLPPVYAEPVGEPYDHAAWMESNGPGR
jgi:hypothetical protein